jgi:rhodanese-related sulfurtransferase
VAAACARTGVGIRTAVPAISPSEAYWRVEHEPETLVLDVREAKSAASAGLIPDSAHIPLEVLSARAGRETPVGARDPRLPDHSRPIIVTCQFGPDGARGAKLLEDVGFADVHYMGGGVQAWIEAGLPTERPHDARLAGGRVTAPANYGQSTAAREALRNPREASLCLMSTRE